MFSVSPDLLVPHYSMSLFTSSRLRLRAPAAGSATNKLATMLSYVPQMVVTQYLDNPQLESPGDAKPESFPAAVLFVDISGSNTSNSCSRPGFTSLNEQYAKQVGGIEIVTKHINGYFKVTSQWKPSHSLAVSRTHPATWRRCIKVCW